MKAGDIPTTTFGKTGVQVSIIAQAAGLSAKADRSRRSGPVMWSGSRRREALARHHAEHRHDAHRHSRKARRQGRGLERKKSVTNNTGSNLRLSTSDRAEVNLVRDCNARGRHAPL